MDSTEQNTNKSTLKESVIDMVMQTEVRVQTIIDMLNETDIPHIPTDVVDSALYKIKELKFSTESIFTITDQLHEIAMDLVDNRVVSRNEELKKLLFELALILEILSIQIFEHLNQWPNTLTKEALYASAGSIALEIGNLESAKKLVEKGLSYSDYDRLLELKEILDNI